MLKGNFLYAFQESGERLMRTDCITYETDPLSTDVLNLRSLDYSLREMGSILGFLPGSVGWRVAVCANSYLHLLACVVEYLLCSKTPKAWPTVLPSWSLGKEYV